MNSKTTTVIKEFLKDSTSFSEQNMERSKFKNKVIMIIVDLLPFTFFVF